MVGFCTLHLHLLAAVQAPPEAWKSDYADALKWCAAICEVRNHTHWTWEGIPKFLLQLPGTSEYHIFYYKQQHKHKKSPAQKQTLLEVMSLCWHHILLYSSFLSAKTPLVKRIVQQNTGSYIANLIETG